MGKLHISLEELQACVHYDPVTGIFTRIGSRKKQYIGKRAGTLHHSGYRFINIHGKVYAEHRLAWLYMYGEILTEMVDHIDGNRSNNKISNLRCATRFNNTSNAIKRKDNSSGVKSG